MEIVIRTEDIRKYALYAFIGSLIAAAGVAVLAVLTGEFNEVMVRVLMTLAMVVVHTLVCLAFIWTEERRASLESLAFFANALFLIFVGSFFTSIFAIWEVIGEETTFKIYRSFFYIGFAALHGNMLSKALGLEKYLDNLIIANYVMIGSVLLMVEYAVFRGTEVLNEMFFRVLAAAGIVNGTMTLLVIIFYKLYMSNNPEKAADLDKTKPSASVFFPTHRFGFWSSLFTFLLFIQLFSIIVGNGRWWRIMMDLF